MTGHRIDPVTSRRAFLAGTVAAATLALLDPPSLARGRIRAQALPAGDPFGLGVASGDPTADGVVLWTRLVAPGDEPLPSGDIPVDWEVATDEALTDVIAQGTGAAIGALGHSVHIEVDGLPADTWLWYRFRAGERTSPVGRTRTFPGRGATPDQVRFATACCQNWADGYYTAYAGIAAEDIDFVVFLGDYIYETSAQRPPRPITLPRSEDVPTYRARYELYKGDPNLQAAHHHVPWIITMDDHEVANNALGDNGQDGEAAGDPAAREAWLNRRADAFQVWYEHQPLRLPPPDGSRYVFYRTVEHSDLLRFHVLDGRQYRSLYPDGTTESFGTDVPGRHAASQTMLGATQEAWLAGAVAAAPSIWNVIAQQTVMTAMPVPVGGTDFYNYDQWDGYVAARARLLRALVDACTPNPIVLSGDIHLAAAGAVRLDYDDPGAPDIAQEFVATSISSRFDPALLELVEAGLAAAPWSRYGNAEQRGYCLMTVTPDRWQADYRVVDVTTETAPVTTDYTDVVTADDDCPVAPPPNPTTTTTTTPGTATTTPSTTTTTPPGGGPGPAQPVPGRPIYTG